MPGASWGGETLRNRLKEAKGIGTPATRADIIGGLKKQSFLIAQGKHIVPTEAGLSVFDILKQADAALVDPGLTAQLECLLDDVVVGEQEGLRIKRSVKHPRFGEIDQIAQPCEITGFDRSIRTATAELGEHNDDILQPLGYAADAIDKPRAAGAI